MIKKLLQYQKTSGNIQSQTKEETTKAQKKANELLVKPEAQKMKA